MWWTSFKSLKVIDGVMLAGFSRGSLPLPNMPARGEGGGGAAMWRPAEGRGGSVVELEDGPYSLLSMRLRCQAARAIYALLPDLPDLAPVQYFRKVRTRIPTPTLSPMTGISMQR